MSGRRARVKLKKAPTTRLQAAAEFGRKKARQRRSQWWQRIALISGGSFVLSTCATLWWLDHTGKLEKAQNSASATMWQWTADAGFKLDQVTLMGRSHADAAAVRDALAISKGAPLLGLSLGDMAARLKKIPEIKAVVVTRRLPNQLAVTITERRPAAFWHQGDQQKLIDAEGVVLDRGKYPEIKKLPIIMGDDAPQHIGELLALMESAPTISPYVISAMRIGERRWNMQMKRDIIVMLPEDQPAIAWRRFATLVARDALLNKAIRSVDMRMEDRVFIMPIEEKQNPVTLTTARDT